MLFELLVQYFLIEAQCDVHFTVATENWVNDSLNPMLIGFCDNMGLYQISNHKKNELENNY